MLTQPQYTLILNVSWILLAVIGTLVGVVGSFQLLANIFHRCYSHRYKYPLELMFIGYSCFFISSIIKGCI